MQSTFLNTPLTVCHMKKLEINELYEKYISWRNGFGASSIPYNLKVFKNYHCKRSKYLTQSIIDDWCVKRDSESENSYYTRIGPIKTFIEFVNNIYGTAFNVALVLFHFKYSEVKIPSKEQYRNLLRAADEESLRIIKPTLTDLVKLRMRLRMLQLPVAYRLIYSSGMRPVEVRKLKRSNVFLDDGKINIVEGKGYAKRVIYLHDSMTDILRKYDAKMERIIPNREYFFCREKGELRSNSWPGRDFSTCWGQYNNEKGYVVNSLRHMYVIDNINSWNNEKEFHENLLILSKTLGHSSVDITVRHYYNYVPALAKLYYEKMGEHYSNMIPDIEDEE